jgi:hypothetical protein
MNTDDTTTFDPRTLIMAANACYAKARDQALPPPVRAKLARAADALAAAVDAHHEATAPSPLRIGGYDHDRCRSCGRVWPLHVIDCAKVVTAEAEAVRLRNGTANATEATHAPD